MKQLDTVLVNYSVAERIYQGLANKFSAIEPPTWSLLLAQACRAKGLRVAILDADAEGLTKEEAYERIKYLNPRFVTLVTYGQNPNSGTTNMAGTYELAKYIKEVSDYPICSIGSHTSALPYEVLAEPFIDFVCINEGVKTLQNLICSDLTQYLSTIPGLGYKKEGKCIVNNGGGTLIKQEEMDRELPGYAWDLLDVPLSKYRAHVWHPNYDESKRSPFAALYTSLGCRFKCDFCLDGNTKIVLSRDKNKLIKDVEIGDKLLAWDENKLSITETTVKKTISRLSDSLYTIKLSDGKTIKCTKEHPFYFNGVWTKAESLRVGDKLLVIDGADKVSFRMKVCNPMYNKDTANKVSQTSKQNILDGKYTPYLSTDKGRKEISDIAREKMLSSENPMLSEINQEKASKRMRGNNNPKWNNGSSAKLRPYYLNKTKKLRKAIKNRDDNKCQECGKNNGKLDAHHIDYNNLNNQLSNLITLCASCHSKTNFDREFWQKRYTKMMLDKSIDCPHYVRIESISIDVGEFQVWNIECDEHNNFFANNILNHNCMINILNREDESAGVHAGNSSQMRYWSPELVLKWFEELANMGVETIRISDEMFYLNKKYYEPILQGIVERGLKICTWTYSRVDTVNERFLELFQKAGVNWLGIGIEAANQTIRADITKGRFKDIDIRDVVKRIENAGINVGANYIFGFPNEKKEDMQATLDLALELNTAFANFYTCTNLPGSPLYYEAKSNGWIPPTQFEGYGFLSYYYEPSPTKYLSAAEVLKFRDEAWTSYFTRPQYLDMIESKFGAKPRQNVEELARIQLKRKALGD